MRSHGRRNRLERSLESECSVLLRATLIVKAFSRGANGQHRTAVLGYVCTTRDLPDAEHINCVRGSNVVTTKSQGY